MSLPADSSTGAPPRSRWFLLLLAFWAVLAFRIGLAIVRAESLKDDLALPTVALFVTSSVLASRVFAAVQRRHG